MLGKRNITVFPAFSLHDMQHFPVEVHMLKFNIPHFHAAQSAAVDEPDEQFVFQEFGGLKHTPDLFPTQDHRKFLDFWNGGKVEVAVGQTFGLQQKAESVNGMFEVRLGRCFGALLEFKQVIFHLFRIQFRRQSSEVQRECRDMPGIIIKGSGAPAQD